MQPILAESASHAGRAVAFAVALAIAASLVLVPSFVRPKHREHHQLPRIGKCVNGYAYLAR
jgi:hypothetical protein